jgi:hypothetical protein
VIHRICRALSCVVFGSAVLAALGCQKEREFAEVEGTIKLEGKPIAGIEVLFLPDAEKGNKGNTSSGMTDKDGRYRIRNDRDQKDGTVLGAHRVVLIDSYANRDPSGLSNPPSRIPAEYADAGQTPLKDVEITSGKQTHDFNLPKPPKK